MTITLTDKKKDKIFRMCSDILEIKHNVTIREVASLIGNLVASFPALSHGELFYRSLEKDKIKALKNSKVKAYLINFAL